MKILLKLIVVLLVTGFLASIVLFRLFNKGTQGPEVGQGKLAECPVTPNCFEKTETYRGTIETQIRYLMEILDESKNMTIKTTTRDFVHATVKSRLYGFIDDFEAKLENSPMGVSIHFRSASRVGHSDLGVNKRRIEKVIKKLVEKNK